MENLAPSLKFILSIRYALEAGQSLHLGLKLYLQNTNDEFASFLLKWNAHFENGQWLDPGLVLKSPTQVVLVHLLHKGFAGQAVHGKLLELEGEVLDKCRLELNNFTQKLSFRLLIPLLMFQFPALLILFLGFLSSQIARNLL